MATHSSILAWRIPWTEEPEVYRPWGCKEWDTTEATQHSHRFQYYHLRHDSFLLLLIDFPFSWFPGETQLLFPPEFQQMCWRAFSLAQLGLYVHLCTSHCCALIGQIDQTSLCALIQRNKDGVGPTRALQNENRTSEFVNYNRSVQFPKGVKQAGRVNANILSRIFSMVLSLSPTVCPWGLFITRCPF